MRQDRIRRFERPTLAIVGAIVCMQVVGGCGDGKIPRYPVKGQVQVDGQPAAGALVIFCPVAGSEGSEEFMRERPHATTDSDGNFELRTFMPGDGAPAGDYQVMVRWPTSGQGSSQSASGDPRDVTGGNDRLRGRYANPETSGIEVTVAEAPNELAPFELSIP